MPKSKGYGMWKGPLPGEMTIKERPFPHHQMNLTLREASSGALRESPPPPHDDGAPDMKLTYPVRYIQDLWKIRRAGNGLEAPPPDMSEAPRVYDMHREPG